MVKRRSSRKRAEQFEAAGARLAAGRTQRQVAADLGVAHSTLQDWRRPVPIDDAPAALAALVRTPEGVRWLHRLVLAAHFTITLRGAAGVRVVCEFLELSGLSAFVGGQLRRPARSQCGPGGGGGRGGARATRGSRRGHGAPSGDGVRGRDFSSRDLLGGAGTGVELHSLGTVCRGSFGGDLDAGARGGLGQAFEDRSPRPLDRPPAFETRIQLALTAPMQAEAAYAQVA